MKFLLSIYLYSCFIFQAVVADVVFEGEWVVESVKIDQLSERTQKYTIDDPRLKGRIFKFSEGYIDKPNSIRCEKPVYTEKSQNFVALINQTFNGNSAIYADVGILLPKSSRLFSVSCLGDNTTDTMAARDWIIIVAPDKLLASSYGPTLLLLTKLESNKPPVPSFACGKASGYIESTICSSHELALFDKSLRQAYNLVGVDSSEAQKTNLKATQLNWIKERNLCKDAECIKVAYERRLEEIMGGILKWKSINALL